VLRTISRVDRLFDASLVTYPAYSGTSVAGTQVQDLSADPGEDDDDEDGNGFGLQYSGAIVPMEVRQRAKRAPCKKPRFANDEERHAALERINQELRADELRRAEADRAIRISQV